MSAYLSLSKRMLTRALLIIVLIAFAIGGVASGVNRSYRSANVVLKVGGVHVTKKDYSRAYQRESAYIRQIAGGSIDNEDLDKLGIGAHVMQELENQALILNFVHSLDLGISNTVILDNVRENAVFSDADGHFNRERFYDVLNKNGYTESSYIQRLRDAITQNNLLSVIELQEFPVNYIANELYRHRFQSRVADFIVLNQEAVTNVKHFTDEELMGFYEKNHNNYYSPEQRKARYVTIGREHITSAMTVTDEEVEAAVQVRVAEEEERRDFTNVVFDSYVDALDFFELVSSPEASFDERARNSKGHVAYMKAVERSELPTEFGNVIFALRDVNNVAAPFNTTYGWHVAKLTNKYIYTAEELRDTVKRSLIEEKTAEALYETIGNIEDEQRRGALIVDIAKTYNLPVTETGYFTFNGTVAGVEGDFPASTPLVVAQAAFSRTKNDKADFLYDSATGQYVLVEITDIANPAQLSFKDVKEQIRSELTQDFILTKLREIADDARQSIVNARDPHRQAQLIAQKNKAVYIPEKTVYRPEAMERMDMASSEYPGEVIEELFSFAKDGETTAAVTYDNNSVVFAVFSGERSAPVVANANHYAIIKNELVKGYRESGYNGMLDFLRTQYKVTRNANFS